MLTHFNKDGKAYMVDVSEKNETNRIAISSGKIFTNDETFKKIKEGDIKKGDVLGVARVAAIMAAKKTSELIPMCHPLFLTGVDIEFKLDELKQSVECIATVKTTGKTGVEMEALTAVNVALLTIYDMCKAMDKKMVIGEIKLLEKQGGKSGHFINR